MNIDLAIIRSIIRDETEERIESELLELNPKSFHQERERFIKDLTAILKEFGEAERDYGYKDGQEEVEDFIEEVKDTAAQIERTIDELEELRRKVRDIIDEY